MAPKSVHALAGSVVPLPLQPQQHSPAGQSFLLLVDAGSLEFEACLHLKMITLQINGHSKATGPSPNPTVVGHALGLLQGLHFLSVK